MSDAPETHPMLITAEQFAAWLQISTRTLWRMKSAGTLPAAIALGGSVRWNGDEVRKWIASGCLPINSNHSHRRKG